MVVWKFTLTGPDCKIQMPRNARILSFGAQDDEIVLWAEVDPSDRFIERWFCSFNTGAELPARTERPLPAPWVGTCSSRSYRGTVQMPSGIVWHIYEMASP